MSINSGEESKPSSGDLVPAPPPQLSFISPLKLCLIFCDAIISLFIIVFYVFLIIKFDVDSLKKISSGDFNTKLTKH